MKIILSSSLLLATATASTPFASKNSRFGIPASSEAGRQLLRHARMEEPPRFLEDEGMNLNLGNMYLKYEGCSNFNTFKEETIFDMYAAAGNEDNGYENWQQQQEEYQQWMNQQQANGNYNNNWNEQQQEGQDQQEGQGGERMLQNNYDNYNGYQNNQWEKQNLVCNQNWKYGKVGYQTKLARFTLCFDGGCNACSGKYAVDLDYFLPVWDQHRQTMDNFICQQLNTYCSNKCNYEASCLYTCMEQSSGPSHCESYGQNNGQQFYLSNYLQCVQMNNVNQQWENGQWQQQEQNAENQGNTYIGPMCKDNGDLYLHTFYDEGCTMPSYNAKFQSPFRSSASGSSFPYFDEPFLMQNSCFSCEDEQELVNKLNEIAQNNNYQFVNNMNPNYYYQNVYQNEQMQEYNENAEGQDEAQEQYNYYAQQNYANYYVRDGDDEEKTVGAMCEIFDLENEEYSWDGYNVNYENKFGDDDRYGDLGIDQDDVEQLCQNYGQDGDEFVYLDAVNRVPVFKCVYSVDEPDSSIIEDCMFLEEVLPRKDGRDAAGKGFFSKQATKLNNLLNDQRKRNYFLVGSIVALGALVAFLFGTRPIDHSAAYDSKTESLVPSRRGDMIVGRDIDDDDASAHGGKAHGTLA